MRVAEAIFVLGVIVVVAGLVVLGIRSTWRAANRYFGDHQPWRASKHPVGDGWEVTVERGKERRVVTTIPAGPSWEIEPELRLALKDAEHEAALLNK